MRQSLFLIAISLSLFLSPVLGLSAEPQLSASVDKQSAHINEEIHLNVRIVGAGGSLQAPHLPSLEGFEIFYSGRASRFSFINGQSESMTEFNYVLIPRSSGRFVLHPIEIKVGDKIYRTNELELNVENHQTTGFQPTPQPQAPTAVYSRPVPQTQPFSSGGAPAQPAPATLASNDATDQNIFLRVMPSQVVVYTNQQLILTYSLFTRYDTRYEGFIEEPETSGFWIEEFPMDQNLARDTEMVKGRKYVRADIKKLALFPTAPGQYQITPGVIKASVQIDEAEQPSMFDEFFNTSFFGNGNLFAKRVEKHLTSPPLAITVRPLPDGGKPDSFNGAVGDFRMSTTVDKRVVNQNEAVTFQITIEGEGNIETLIHPPLPEIHSAKIYEADTQTQLFRAQNVIAGKKVFEIVIIPGEAGEMTIPVIEFGFFNPKMERYVILKSESYKIKVNPSKTPPPAIPKEISEANLGDTRKSIRSETENIQYIKEQSLSLKPSFLPRFIFWFAFADGLLTLLCLGLAIARKRSEYLDQNISLKRNLFAKKYASLGLRRLDRLAKASRSDLKSDEIFFDESAKILNQYLADKLNLSPQGLTQNTVEFNLGMRQVNPAIIQKIRDCYDLCDQIRFAKIGLGEVDRASMIKQIKEIIYALEK